MRLAAYTGASVALATGVFLKALHQRSNVYAACVYLSQSSANLMILTNLCLIITGFVLFWLQRLLYGPLRPIETEQLYERAWFAVTETCLAMTIFRGELGGWFLVMFISLLVGKVWGWIGEGRVEYLEQQPPANPRLFHTRLAISLVLSVLFNAFMLRYCINTVIHQARPDMMVMFGFEFAILTILSSSTTARYGIALTEIYITRQQVKAKMAERRAEIRGARLEAIREHARAGESSPPTNLPDENDVNELEIDVPGWEEKGRWVFYLDLLTDFVKLMVYLIFFAILLTFYGLPIHILRDVVVTIRSFARRIMDFLRFRNATRDMNERYPDATAEEVAREEVCIICREEMVSAQPAPGAAGETPAPQAAGAQRVPDRLRPKKLPCGHILHFSCLRSWLERQQNCPTCRRPVVRAGGAQGVTGANANNAGNGAGGVAPNMPGGNQAPGQPGVDGAPRARVYQFGPFRIGFGAVRGDLLQNLHQQVHQGNAPLQPAPNANPQGARQIGFGFGFGRRPPVPTPQGQPQGQPQDQPQFAQPSNFFDVHSQLQQIEQQIAQEINSLRAVTEHFRHVQSLAQGFRPVNSSRGPNSSTLTSGDSRLPEGLTLPAGWSLVPLQSTESNLENLSSLTQNLVDPDLPEDALSSTRQQAAQTSQTHTTPATVVPQGDSSHLAQPATAPNSQTGTSTAETAELGSSNPLSDLSQCNGTSSTVHRADSPSQEWTDVRSDQVPAPGPSTNPPNWGSGMEFISEPEIESTDQGSLSKGKGRTATVEEADEDAS
ncbi:E3 ubiquitin-protein ligase hrd1 [Penicillium argentinense]|uniref:RING-type E3 ubiquitin transferase n=1 Tax=Penicillium argentinense TaxID=1131581 RepID=A0A9W9JYN1_9EURO|nr:E3 ubiquitin-protein ligase hrd1 [Penicillium argentinense]KAJ5085727.1 E3 ubiquitin-protein ligase hrd1 [Penicillium argentinense]